MCIHTPLLHKALNPREHQFCNIITGAGFALKSLLEVGERRGHGELQGWMAGTSVCSLQASAPPRTGTWGLWPSYSVFKSKLWHEEWGVRVQIHPHLGQQ